MKKITKFALLLIALFLITKNFALAADINLTIRDGESVVFTGTVSLPTEITTINDSASAPHTIDASSVLAALSSADQASESFSISNLTYFSSFNSLYVKCITNVSGEKCDDWQYTVNGSYPGSSMDQNILSGGENIYVYFGPQNRVILSSSNINAGTTLTATSQKYDYENNSWVVRTGVTIGITKPNPDDPFSPLEIKTSPVNENGEATFSELSGDSYNVGVKEDFYFPSVALTVSNPASSGSSGNVSCCTVATGTVLGATVDKTAKGFDVAKAVEFIITQQKDNGSFGENIYTDWITLALAPYNYQEQTIKLIKYLTSTKLENPLLTDYERHAMALMSLGLNPYNTNGENYIEKITSSFDGKQFGDIHEDNDDIFALISLQNAGYTENDKMIMDDINFILKTQSTNGSWDESPDMTGAGIVALANFQKNEKVYMALARAKEFLKQNQQYDGGWGNASSTAWAIEGILALGEKPEDWKKNDPMKYDAPKSPLDYLASIQDTDGGVKNENMQTKIWETSYAVSALSGKNWSQIMQKFEKSQSMPTKKINSNSERIVKAARKTPPPEKNKNTSTDNTPTILNTPGTDTEVEKETGWFSKILNKIVSVF